MAFFEETTWHALVAVAVLCVLVVTTLLWLDHTFGEDAWVPAMGFVAGLVLAADVALRWRARRA